MTRLERAVGRDLQFIRVNGWWSVLLPAPSFWPDSAPGVSCARPLQDGLQGVLQFRIAEPEALIQGAPGQDLLTGAIGVGHFAVEEVH